MFGLSSNTIMQNSGKMLVIILIYSLLQNHEDTNYSTISINISMGKVARVYSQSLGYKGKDLFYLL